MFIFLARLIVFLIAISAIRSVVRYILGMFTGAQARPPAGQATRQAPGRASDATMLKQDPVCGTYVAIDTSLKKISGGQVYHFCSAECRDRFAS